MARINRRKFLAGVVAAGAGTCACGMNGCATFTKAGDTSSIPAGAYVVKDKSIVVFLNKVPELAKIGGSIKIIDKEIPQPVILVRAGETQYTVVSLRCPHRGVEVEYKRGDGEFRCASIGHSTFAADGTYKKGFAKKSLTRFDAILDPSDSNSLIIRLS